MLLNISSRGYGVNAQPCPAAAGEAAEDRSRELGLPLYKLERWRQKAEAALDGALKERETDAVIGKLATAMQRIGELSMEGSASGPWFAGPHSPWSDPSLHSLLGGSRHLVHQLRCVMGRSDFFARGRGAWRAESTPSPHDARQWPELAIIASTSAAGLPGHDAFRCQFWRLDPLWAGARDHMRQRWPVLSIAARPYLRTPAQRGPRASAKLAAWLRATGARSASGPRPRPLERCPDRSCRKRVYNSGRGQDCIGLTASHPSLQPLRAGYTLREGSALKRRRGRKSHDPGCQ